MALSFPWRSCSRAAAIWMLSAMVALLEAERSQLDVKAFHALTVVQSGTGELIDALPQEG